MAPTPSSTAAQDAARVTANEAWGIVSRLLGGMMVYGLLGWLLGRWLERPVAGLSIGVLLGISLGLYLSVIRVNQLGVTAPPVPISGTQSWSARMTRARIERSSEVTDGS